jgi:peptidoglycan/LPS O-acetylase OafA/YrhL
MGTTTTAPPTTADGRPSPVASHIGGLDGLRGLAVAAVVAYHLDVLSGGFLGVDVFFVLSGFLITSLLLSEHGRSGTVSLRRFWARRIRRLVPAVAVVVPVTLAAAVLLDWPRTRLGSAAIDGFATLTWWANWRQAGGTSYWATDNPNLFRHAWSLAIEEQFYLVWPLAVVLAAALAHRWGRSVAAAVGATAAVGFAASSVWLVVLSRRLADDDLSRAYVGTDTRVLAPLAGCVLACWLARGRRSVGRRSRVTATRLPGLVLRVLGVVGLGVLTWSVVASDVASPTLYRGGGFVVVAVAAVAVVAWIVVDAADGAPGASSRWATVGVLRYLGLRSYGIYLWSWPLQVLGEHRFPSAPRGVLVPAVVVASLVVAEASYRLVEDPIRRRRSWAARPALRRPTVRVPALAAALTVPFLVVVAVDRTAEDPPVHERLDADDALAEAAAPPPTRPVEPEPPPVPGPSPTPGQEDEPAEPLYVMVAGDSIGWTIVYYLEFDLGAAPEGIASVDGRAIIGCGVLAGDGWEYREASGAWGLPAGGDCVRQRDAEATGLSGSPDVVLTMPGGWEAVDTRSPDGRVVEAQSPEMEDLLVEALVERAQAAHDAGAAYGLVEWACPGSNARVEVRDDGYVRWINATIERVAEEARSLGIDAFVIEADEAVCTGADPTGEPTAERITATGDETHAIDNAGAKWFWQEWLGPALLDRMG